MNDGIFKFLRLRGKYFSWGFYALYKSFSWGLYFYNAMMSIFILFFYCRC